MWVEIFCGLIVYRLFRGFFNVDNDDDALDVETSDSRALFSVANRYLLIYILIFFIFWSAWLLSKCKTNQRK